MNKVIDVVFVQDFELDIIKLMAVASKPEGATKLQVRVVHQRQGPLLTKSEMAPSGMEALVIHEIKQGILKK